MEICTVFYYGIMWKCISIAYCKCWRDGYIEDISLIEMEVRYMEMSIMYNGVRAQVYG